MSENRPHVSRALILAAGQGSRLRDVSGDRPKVLTVVNGHPILAWQQCALQTRGIFDLALVTGFRAELLAGKSRVMFYNSDFARSNMLWSLWEAREWLDRGLVISYSDILYTHEVVDAVVSTPGDIVIATDPAWEARYEGRTQHPVDEAEVVEFASDEETVISVGKRASRINSGRVEEFIGVMRLSQEGCKTFLDFFEGLLSRSSDGEEQITSWLKHAYICDFLTYLIAKGISVKIASTEAPWIEIDTPQDLVWARANWKASLSPDC